MDGNGVAVPYPYLDGGGSITYPTHVNALSSCRHTTEIKARQLHMAAHA